MSLTDLKILPHSWIEVSIKDINLKVSGSTNPANTKNIKYTLYSVPAFDSMIPEELFGKDIGSTKQCVENGDILICKINPRINRVWVVDNHNNEKKIASSEWIVINSNDLVNSIYLKYAFSAPFFRKLITAEVSGVGGSLTRAKPSLVINYKIPLAPSKEQTRIVQKLDKLFALIENIKERTANVLSNKNELISSFLFNANNSSLGYEPLNDYVEEGTNRIGVTWLDVPKIGVSNTDGITELRTGLKKTFEKYKVVKPGDFIYNTMRVNIGSIARYQGHVDAITSPDYVVFRVKGKLSPELLLNYLKSEGGKLEINSKTRGGVRSRLYFKSLKQIRIPNINIEQHNLAERLFLFFRDYTEMHKLLLKNLENLSASILNKAFRGELVPQDHNDELAQKLLERIIKEKAKLKKTKK